MIHFNIRELVEGSSVGNLLREEYMEWNFEADLSTLDSFRDCTGRTFGKKKMKETQEGEERSEQEEKG